MKNPPGPPPGPPPCPPPGPSGMQEVDNILAGMIALPGPGMKNMDPSNKRSLDEQTDDPDDLESKMNAKKAKPSDMENRKIYIGNLPPSVTEKPLVAHFRAFGHVVNCQVVRDRDSGVSRGFAFLTFMDETEADCAVDYPDHALDGKPIRVSRAQKQGQDPVGGSMPRGRSKRDFADFETVTVSRFQTRVYLGPLDADVENPDIGHQLGQYGIIKNITIIKAEVSSVKRSFASVEFQDSISVKRTFSQKIFIKGKHVKITLSKLAMELILSTTVAFFYEAHEYCSAKKLENHFKQYGQVFRACQFLEEDLQRYKSYGFVDFIGAESVPDAVATKQQLVNDQFIRVSKFMPQKLMFDLHAISDKLTYAMLKKMEEGSREGTWGVLPKKEIGEVTESQVRIPSKFVARLIGERGKTITEISRDSKTKINIPRFTDETNKITS